MTEPVDDNIPTVDKIVYIENDDQTLVSDTDNDNDDLHVCRKCNKVFKNLPEYLEHKVKYENYRISQTRSKLDRRMVLPQLVQKQKRKTRKEKDTQQINNINLTNPEHTNSSKAASVVNVGCELQLEKSLGKDGNCTELKEDNVKEDQSPKKRGRKRKSVVPEVRSVESDLEIMYMCTVCDKKFRREATLRWHMKYEHKDDKETGEDSDDESVEEASAENDGNFRVEMEKEEKGDHNFEEDEHKTTQEIHVIIQQQNIDKLETTDLEDGDLSSQYHKQTIIKCDKETVGKDSDRPYVCDICNRRFKELTVLKSHAVVHSDERKFICTAENCPYGFKTKGGLVRHMRRHTGERPYACENCGRAFSESGALTRHMKSRRNCAQTPDSAYPRYMKNWTYHPNIPAVIDPLQRDAHQGRSTLQHSVRITQTDETEGEIHYLITESEGSDIMTAEVIAPHDSGMGDVTATVDTPEVIVPQLIDGSNSALQIKLEQEDVAETVEWTPSIGTVHDATDIITVGRTDVLCEIIKPLDAVLAQQVDVAITTTQQILNKYTDTAEVDSSPSTGLMKLNSSAEAQFLKPTQCCVCRKDLGTIEGLEIHLRSHLADQPSRCGLCHFLSHDREELRHHILSMHYDSLNDIEASVLSMEEEEGVKSETTQEKRITTRDALVAVKQLYSLKKQKSDAEVEKSCPTASGSLQCMVCNRFFRGSSYLRQHMRTHTGDRPHQCHVCHRSFTSRDILKKHMYVHKDQRDFKCGECGKLFKRLAHVQQHLRIHSQERSFRCSLCDKLFKTQNSLTVHMRTHSGVNPYKCHVCNRHFRERGSLQRHMRLHTGEKPYKCHLCNRAFAEHGTLSRHLKAKVPCSGSHNITQLDQNQASNMLTQFSTVVANTQHYIQNVDSGQQFMIPSIQEMGDDYVVLDTTAKGSEEIENVEVTTEEGVPCTIKPDGDLDGQETESLHIFDSETGESVIIVAEKSIVDLIREHQLSIESGEAGSSLQKIKDILHAVRNITSISKEEFSTALEQPQDMICIEQEKYAIESNQENTEQKNENASNIKEEVYVSSQSEHE